MTHTIDQLIAAEIAAGLKGGTRSGASIRDHQGGDGIPAFPPAGTERGKWGMDADQPGNGT